MKKTVLLSFDIEEFDFPRERGEEISVEEGVRISSIGTEKILKVLRKNGVKATFFVTGNFATVNPELVKEMAAEGHEIACHGVDHFQPAATDPKESRRIIKKLTGAEPAGYRQPRMFKINYEELARQGYKYDSSVNPAFIPGRYNNFKTLRRPYKEEGVVEIPTSAATVLRIPLFWLALHLFPRWLYLGLTKSALKRQGYFTTYFHPWEFTNLKKYAIVPWYIKMNSGNALVGRLDWLIGELKKTGADFAVYSDFVKTVK